LVKQVLVKRFNHNLLIALALAFAFHGGLLISGSFTHTYDAYIHIFFGDHYARYWFDHWEYRWYTGFPLTSYPPGSQQAIGLLSLVVGLLNGFIIVQLSAILLVTIGIYRFSKIWVSEEAAGYAALLLVFSSSICETVHVFGQLPTTFSLGFLLNALPYVRSWLDEGKWTHLLAAWSLNAATTAGHHVTTLFGAVFFVAPVIVAAIVERFRQPLPDEPLQHPARVTRRNFWPLVVRRLRRIIPITLRAGIYGIGLVAALVLVVLPYWLWSKDDPISQVPIPHASRDSFIANPNAGIVFWLLPYGLSLIALPYAFYKGLSTKAWPMGLSLAALFFLGTGGTTPFPEMLLKGAYYILTLDRFTFWATITVLPLLGEFVVSLRHRGLAKYLREQFGTFTWRSIQFGLLIAYLAVALISANFTQFRRFQPTSIDMQPIVNFLEKDQHTRWRYMTLGFGDQMAWLSAQTTATSVDGNYHSARRLPEMTTTSVERLEGAKFRGVAGIGSLQQFLAVPEKYNLKFIFSNDQFYDPLLFFSGWHRLQRLENGIMVWEREDIPPLPEVLPRKEIPIYQRIMWGIVPIAAIFTGLLVLSGPFWFYGFHQFLIFLGFFHISKILLWPINLVRKLRKKAPALSENPDAPENNETSKNSENSATEESVAPQAAIRRRLPLLGRFELLAVKAGRLLLKIAKFILRKIGRGLRFGLKLLTALLRYLMGQFKAFLVARFGFLKPHLSKLKAVLIPRLKFLEPLARKVGAPLLARFKFLKPLVSKVKNSCSGPLKRPKFIPPHQWWAALQPTLLRWSQLPPGEEASVKSKRWQLWRDWFGGLKRAKPAPPTARQVRSSLLFTAGGILILVIASRIIGQSNDPVKIVEAYYDDLDFRRFNSAYARLDPVTKPTYELYRLQQSVVNGLVASYGKLDSVKVRIISNEPDQVVVEANTLWVTALENYPTTQRHTLVKRNGRWYITPDAVDLTTPPDQFFRQSEVTFHSQGRRQVTTNTTAMGDVLDRPVLQILSARLVKYKDQYSVVGEVINTDVNPADLTVTAVLYDEKGNILTSYNAQDVAIHKLFPKEITPFRVNFEGVAGAVFSDAATAGDFKPGAFSPTDLKEPVVSFDVFAKAVVTQHDLSRNLGIQDMKLGYSSSDAKPRLSGQLLNSGTVEATIPHLLVTYYDDASQVVWVDELFVENAVRPQLTQPFSMPITPFNEVKTVLVKKDIAVSAVAVKETSIPGNNWLERLPLPSGLGYSSLRVSVHYYTGAE
jgi:hypothetical protein